MDSLPELLVDPPWEKAARQPKPAKPKEPEPRIVPGLEPPSEMSVVWAPKEREQWMEVRSYSAWPRELLQIVQQYVENPTNTYPPTAAAVFAKGPEEVVRPLLGSWRPRHSMSYFGTYLKPVVARFESDARPAVLHSATLDFGNAGEALLPFLDAEVVRMMADGRFRLKTAQGFTWAYFRRHGPAAVPFLVPDALGKSRPARRKALAALWQIVDEFGFDAVIEAARPHGTEALEALAEALRGERPTAAVDKKPVEGPPTPPKLPWLDVAALPAPVLRDGGEPLPPGPTGNLISHMALSGDDPSPQLRALFTLFTPESLTVLSRAIFDAWRAAREPSRNNWVMAQLGWFGDDETVRRLTPIIRAWPGASGHHKAVRGLDVLIAIGTDVALIHLNGIAQKVKFNGLKQAAREAIDAVAKERGLTPDQLADRLVPDFGLDADGGLTLDYGPRQFRVAFDEQLKPYVTDADGKIRKSLPKPGAKDDPEKAPAAHQRYATLKKDVRTVAADQLLRLESAMVTGRHWTSGEFQTYFADHPLIWHIARRLVWLADGHPFRIAEDRTLADAEDETFALPQDAKITIAHPIDLGDDAAAWSALFADYEILQPFPQLGRPVHKLTAKEAASSRLTRFENLTVSTYQLLGLTRHGWQRGAPQDNGIEHEITLKVSENLWVIIVPSPGITVGALDIFPEQTLAQVTLATVPYNHRPKEGGPTFNALTPVMASEVLTHLTTLTSG